MLNNFKISTVLIALLMGLSFQTGCFEDSSDDLSLGNMQLLMNLAVRVNGYWNSGAGDGFEITSASGTYMYYQYDNLAKDISFAGEIVNYNNAPDGSGYITMKITNSGTWNKTVGNFYTVHVENYTGNVAGNTIDQSSAFKAPFGDPLNDGRPTQEAAEALYTVANGYFDFHGTYTKQ